MRGYSQGMRQRLGIAMALLPVPELLILDEPTNGLDPAGIHEMRELIRRMPEQDGVTVFLSSHLLTEIEQLATHIGIIDRGHVIFEGAPDELAPPTRTKPRSSQTGRDDAQQLLRAGGWASSYNGNGHLTRAGQRPVGCGGAQPPPGRGRHPRLRPARGPAFAGRHLPLAYGNTRPGAAG